MNKKIKSNRYKPEVKRHDTAKSESGFGIDFCLKCIMTVAAISLVSLASIFTYDFITQSRFFSVQTIEISGTHRATESEVLKLGQLKPGMNLFELNLFSIEKKITIIALPDATSTAFHAKTVRDRRGEVSSRCKSRERKNIFNVEMREDNINIMNMVKKVMVNIFSLRKSLNTSGNSSW